MIYLWRDFVIYLCKSSRITVIKDENFNSLPATMRFSVYILLLLFAIYADVYINILMIFNASECVYISLYRLFFSFHLFRLTIIFELLSSFFLFIYLMFWYVLVLCLSDCVCLILIKRCFLSAVKISQLKLSAIACLHCFLLKNEAFSSIMLARTALISYWICDTTKLSLRNIIPIVPLISRQARVKNNRFGSVFFSAVACSAFNEFKLICGDKRRKIKMNSSLYLSRSWKK